jgi:hypothetical protein
VEPGIHLGEITLKRISRLVLIVVMVLPVVAPAASLAQDHYTYTLSGLGGLGGSVDADDASLGNQSFGLGLSLLREDRVHIGLRLVQVDFDSQDQVGNWHDVSLEYLTAGGEYRFLESFYESGLFMGLGVYELEGRDADGLQQSETSVGFVLGVTGEFEINRRFGFLVEFMGHVTDLEESNIFATGHAGLAVHF